MIECGKNWLQSSVFFHRKRKLCFMVVYIALIYISFEKKKPVQYYIFNWLVIGQGKKRSCYLKWTIQTSFNLKNYTMAEGKESDHSLKLLLLIRRRNRLRKGVRAKEAERFPLRPRKTLGRMSLFLHPVTAINFPAAIPNRDVWKFLLAEACHWAFPRYSVWWNIFFSSAIHRKCGRILPSVARQSFPAGRSFKCESTFFARAGRASRSKRKWSLLKLLHYPKDFGLRTSLNPIKM